MDIHADLLLDNLKNQFFVTCCGKLNKTPLLRPVFYQEGDAVEKNRVYLVRPHTLPPKHLLDTSNLLICAEGAPSLAYQHSGIALFIVQSETVMSVFNEVLAIFERYDVWEKSLNSIVNSNVDIVKMVHLTAPLLCNDLTVADKNLQVIAAARYTLDQTGDVIETPRVPKFSAMPIDILRQYRREIEENQNKRGAFFSEDGCYCINFFHEDVYYGNVSLFPRVGKLRKSDLYIMDIFSNYVWKAYWIQINAGKHDANAFETTMRKLLDGNSVSQEELLQFQQEKLQTAYSDLICFCVRLPSNLYQISAESICKTFTSNIQHLVAISYQSFVIGVYGVLKQDGAFEKSVKDVLENLDLTAGISNRFQNIQEIRFFYQQALCALSVQENSREPKRLAYFSDCALQYLMMNSSGIFPAKYVCPPGLRQLREYGENSHVDYWGTLRCYLDEQMNLAQTAKLLGVHRNTLIQRMEKISVVLDLDLKDPMQRLWTRVAMYLFDTEDIMSTSHPES